MRNIWSLGARRLVTFVFVGIASVSGLLAQGAAPFRAGEVVVSGAPDSLPPDVTVVRYLQASNLSIVESAPGQEQALAQQLGRLGRRAGVNRIASASATVNDPFRSFQWHFDNVQAEAAWDITAGFGVTVAVLDTGLREGADGVNDVVSFLGNDIVNGDDDPDDGDGHGTHVAGTIAGASNNGVGVAGLAFEASIMPVKVLDDSGSGSFAVIAEGIYRAVDEGAQVINMSLGVNARFGITNDPVMDSALDYAFDNGVTVVCASGNDGHRKNVSYPAIYPTTIAVGATDSRDRVTRYSNRGAGLDLVAPGGDLNRDDNGDGYGDGVLQETHSGGSFGFYFYQGTSMASPHVAAVAALLIANGTAVVPSDVFDALKETTLDIGDSGYDSVSGYGLVQAFDALNWTAPIRTDFDGDGYFAEVDDCDDMNPAINPGATEICDDGIDNDCDGLIDEDCGGSPVLTDADGDGYYAEEDDCDDTDPNVNPGRTDTKGKWGRDGVDNDCNGVIDG
jgi:serine protease